MSQKVKAPNEGSGKGFLWGIVAIIAIAVVVGGFFVKNGQERTAAGANMPQDAVNFEVSFEDNAVVMAAANLQDGAPTVEIYQDFSCPHCAALSVADHAGLQEALEAGKVKVLYRNLNFLDQGPTGSSTRGASAVMTVAETGDAKATWNLQSYLFENQNDVARKWDNEAMSRAIANYTTDADILEQVKSGKNQQQYQEVFQSNYDRLQKAIGTVSTPQVFVDGEQLQLKADPNTGDVASWVADVVG